MVISHFKPKMRSLLREYNFRIRNKQRHQATRQHLEIFFALSFLSHTVLLPLGLTREWDTGFEFASHDFVENLLRQDSESECGGKVFVCTNLLHLKRKRQSGKNMCKNSNRSGSLSGCTHHGRQSLGVENRMDFRDCYVFRSAFKLKRCKKHTHK